MLHKCSQHSPSPRCRVKWYEWPGWQNALAPGHCLCFIMMVWPPWCALDTGHWDTTSTVARAGPAQAAAFSRQRLETPLWPLSRSPRPRGAVLRTLPSWQHEEQCWCLYYEEREKDRNCWERHSKGARNHSSCFTEWAPVWAEKLWQRSGVRTFPAETLRLMTPTLREESWVWCVIRPGLGVLNVTSHGSEWLWLLISVWSSIEFPAVLRCRTHCSDPAWCQPWHLSWGSPRRVSIVTILWK